MTIILPGGSGFLGKIVGSWFEKRGDEVVVLTRSPSGEGPGRQVGWDGKNLGEWAEEIDGADVVINLAGRSVNCRYTEENRRAIMDSRVASTRVIGEAIAQASSPPSVWLQSSTATIYAHTFGAAHDEANGIIGGDEPDVPPEWRFSIEVAQAWERELDAARTPATRRLALRTAVVMGRGDGSPFEILERLVRFGFGGPVGSGDQWVSWIHADDFCRALLFLIERDDLSGVVNLAAPHPITNRDLMRAIRKAVGMPIGLPAPTPLLKIGTRILGTEPELVLKSRKVVPGRLIEEGFTFEFPEWSTACSDLVDR